MASIEHASALAAPTTEAAPVAALSVEQKRDLLKNLLSLRTAASGGSFPLSHGQLALWFVYKLAPASPAYNFLYAARLRGPVELPALVRTWKILTDRHAALRTRFVVQDGRPLQVVDSAAPVDVPVIDAAGWTEEQLLDRLRAEADRPFDLERGRALRMEVYRRSPSELVLLFVFHHIIADLWSMDLLFQELQQVYADVRAGRNVSLPPQPAQFADFVRTNAGGTQRGR